MIKVPNTAERPWVGLIISSALFVLTYDIIAIVNDQKARDSGSLERFETLSKTLRRKRHEHWGYVAVPTAVNVVLWAHLYGGSKLEKLDPIGGSAKLIRKVVKNVSV